MTADNFISCQQCGGAMVQTSPPGQSPLIVKCQYCGHEEGAIVDPPAPWKPDQDAANQSAVIVRRQKGPASAQELRNLRQLDPAFAEMPAKEAAALIGASEELNLGAHDLDKANALADQARAFGFEAMVQSPPREEQAADDLTFWDWFTATPTTVDGQGQTIHFGCVLVALVGALSLIALVIFLISR